MDSTRYRSSQLTGPATLYTLPKIERRVAAMEPPSIAKIYRPSPKELVFEDKPGSVKQVELPFG